jgi:hypothetical protein
LNNWPQYRASFNFLLSAVEISFFNFDPETDQLTAMQQDKVQASGHAFQMWSLSFWLIW